MRSDLSPCPKNNSQEVQGKHVCVFETHSLSRRLGHSQIKTEINLITLSLISLEWNRVRGWIHFQWVQSIHAVPLTPQMSRLRLLSVDQHVFSTRMTIYIFFYESKVHLLQHLLKTGSTLCCISLCPACFWCSQLLHTWFKWSTCHRALLKPDNEPFIRFRCAGAGNHPKHAAQGERRTEWWDTHDIQVQW